MIFQAILFVAASAAQANMLWAADFSFDDHWKQPIPLQGEAPAFFSDLEKSLKAENCGGCHDTQYEDWKKSRHSISMGPGITGQLGEPWLDKGSIEMCHDCHAPLGEQRPYRKDESGVLTPNEFRDAGLAPEGLTCAACHVRKHKRFGPAPKEPKVADPPHGGFVEVKNFGDSEFCKPCHQFGPDGRRVEEKLLEDTYNQWKESRFAKEGVQCATCHMPDRRHLWKGIHDKEMVLKGVTITAERVGREIKITITNSGVGHLFPTYVTPQIAIQGVLTVDGEQTLVTGDAIGWFVELNLKGAKYDTRIAPGESRTSVLPIPLDSRGGTYTVIITVYPDEFYNRFFKTLIDNPPVGVDVDKLKKAYNDTAKSSYTLYEKSWNLSEN